MGGPRRYAKCPSLWQGHIFELFILSLLVTVIHLPAALTKETDTATAIPKLKFPVADAGSEELGPKFQIQDGRRKERKLNFTMLSDGDEVACMPISEQLSLSNDSHCGPVQMKPSSHVKQGNTTKSSKGGQLANQTFLVEFGPCPEGFIPIRRSRDIYNLTSFAQTLTSLSHEGYQSTEIGEQDSMSKKQYRAIRKSRPPSFSKPSDGNYTADDQDFSPHEHAFVVVNNTKKFMGMEVILNLWSPYVENEDEFSLAQFWLISGSYQGNSSSTILNTIEAGWQVFEGLYGDSMPRLFIFWTADAYNDTGCYNLYCSGFVQVSNTVLVGGSFIPFSVINSTQYEIDLLVFKDPISGNWWLLLNDEPVGYWPSEIFKGQMRESAEVLEFGGEIIDDFKRDHYRHTMTDMGSGAFPQAGHKIAAYQRNIQSIDENHQLHDAQLILGRAESPNCYQAEITTEFKDWGSHFFFGGQGYSPTCPHNRSTSH